MNRKSCKGCRYNKCLSGNCCTSPKVCHYLLDTDQVRPCPADNCTMKATGKGNHHDKQPMPPLPEFRKACAKLVKAGFTRDKIHCYVLSYGKDMDADEARARAVYEAGAMPFMQLYRDFSEAKTSYSKDWNTFARMWQRPAATRAHMEKGTSYKDFDT